MKEPQACEMCGEFTKVWTYDRLSFGIRPVCPECVKQRRKKPGKRRGKRRDLPGQKYLDFENQISVPDVASVHNPNLETKL
jgi:hypothetical protein